MSKYYNFFNFLRNVNSILLLFLLFSLKLIMHKDIFLYFLNHFKNLPDESSDEMDNRKYEN